MRAKKIPRFIGHAQVYMTSESVVGTRAVLQKVQYIHLSYTAQKISEKSERVILIYINYDRFHGKCPTLQKS